MQATAIQRPKNRLQPVALIELLKPITWFPPMWAFGCGLVSSGASFDGRLWFVIGGIALAGPLMCGTSQVVNDWFDRHVDAVNQPERPIPSGRVPGRIGLWFAIVWSLLSIAVAAALGIWVLAAGTLGLALAWAYSAPPARLKLNGWWGNSAVGLCYEGLPWFTAAAALSGTLPGWEIITLAALYSLGAHGIMTLNDFKALKGDRLMGIRSLPVQLGPERAAKVACWVMAVPQLVVVGLLIYWQAPVFAAAVAIGITLQLLAMGRLLNDPERWAPWYNGTGVTLYVLGMLVSAFALRLEVLT
ncbi:MAG: chlorophyll synthase ChlG [Lysobacterales bacterium]